MLTDGYVLPPDFAAWTHGHALTSYRSQGSTSEESLLVLGEVAARAHLIITTCVLGMPPFFTLVAGYRHPWV